ncbi:MAG: HlyD family type I secretion periplasmic adaptor subunit [Gammaproteobacteria bacterium]
MKMEPNNKKRRPSWLKFVTDRRQTRITPTITILEEIDSPRIALHIIVSITAFIVLIIVWAAWFKIEEVTVTHGKIVPSTTIPVVQHLEGGIIEKILVKEGDEVVAGQLLIKLQPISTQADLHKLQARELKLASDAKRLQNLSREPLPKIGKPQEVASTATITNELLGSADSIENKLLQKQHESWHQQIAILQKQLEQQQLEKNKFSNEIAIQKNQINLLRQEVNMYEQLVKTDTVSKREYLIAQREMNKAKADLLRLQSSYEIAQQKIAEYKHRIHELNSASYKTNLEELTQVKTELLEIRSAIEKINDQYNRLDIRAPVSGIVQGLDASNGKVISPGETILEIVPNNHEMLLEIQISTQDIGHIIRGDKAKIKIHTFDYAKYGQLNGRVITISASTFLNGNGNAFYKGLIKLEKQCLVLGDKCYRLLPGMTATADIVTGKKTILSYLIKPVSKTLDNAFKER